MEKKIASVKLVAKCLLTLCLALSASAAGAGKIYFTDEFENGLSKWLVAGDTWQVTDLYYHSPGHSASDSPQGGYAGNANAIMTMRSRVDLSASTSPVLRFWHVIGVYGGDYGYVEVSEDGGLTWKTLTSFTDTWRSTWSQVQVDLSAYKSSKILIRFRLRDNGDTWNNGTPKVGWGWNIDDVQIGEPDPDTLPFPLFDDFESGTDNWVFGDWQETASYSHSSTHCMADSNDAYYPGWACSDLILAHPIDLRSSTFPVLSFWHRIGVYDNDYGYVEVSQDGGLTWKTLTSFTNMWRSTWSREQIDLSPYKSSKILIRFRLRDTGDTWNNGTYKVGWGWDIDDVAICEQDRETLAFPLFDDFESGTDNWVFGDWQETTSYSRSSTHCMTDSNNVNYPGHACSDLILAHPIDLRSSIFPVLSFWHRIGVYNGDYAYVEVSEDRGFSWHAVDPNQPDRSRFTNVWYANWTPEIMDLSPYRGSSILIRFRLRDNGDTWNNSTYKVSSGWDIDDVEVKELFPPDLHVEMTVLTPSQCPTVQATVIVSNSDGNPVTHLPASAFSVFEDGNLQDAKVVETSSHTICASLALDFSGSVTPAIPDIQWAAQQFVDRMRLGDASEIIKFADGNEVAQAYTSVKTDLGNAIWRPPIVQPTCTALYDATYLAILDTAAQQGCDSKAVVVMTDGKDTCSKHSATEVIELAKRLGVRIFTIGLEAPLSGDRINEDVLKAMATLTGGVYYYAPKSEDLEAIYLAIAGTLQDQYLVTYETAACGADKSTSVEHEVKITVTAPAGVGLDTERFRCPTECKP